MKNTKLFCILTFLILSIVVLSSCSAGTPNAEKIKNDLNATEFVKAENLYGNDEDKVISVTDVKIINSKKEHDSCRITCAVVQQDKNYKKESQLVISYNKLDKWFLDTYNATSVVVMPLSGVPDEMIRNSYEVTSLAGYDDNKATVECTNISHDFNSSSLTDKISVECAVTSETCKRIISLSLDYKFDNQWKREHKEQKTISRQWLVENLIGTTWQTGMNFLPGVRTVRINSIDTSNQTINLNYRYSSLTQSEVCEYKIKDSDNNGGEQSLVVPLTYDFYELRMLDDMGFGAN